MTFWMMIFLTVMAFTTGTFANTAQHGTEQILRGVESNNLHEIKNGIKNRGNINSQNADGETPLIVAVKLGNYAVIETLLKNNADPFIANKDGENAGDIAHRIGSSQIIKLIETYQSKLHAEREKAYENSKKRFTDAVSYCQSNQAKALIKANPQLQTLTEYLFMDFTRDMSEIVFKCKKETDFISLLQLKGEPKVIAYSLIPLYLKGWGKAIEAVKMSMAEATWNSSLQESALDLIRQRNSYSHLTVEQTLKALEYLKSIGFQPDIEDLNFIVSWSIQEWIHNPDRIKIVTYFDHQRHVHKNRILYMDIFDSIAGLQNTRLGSFIPCEKAKELARYYISQNVEPTKTTETILSCM